MTATIQHEYLAIHAGDILRQSQALDIPEKATDEQGPVEMDLPDLHHLALRGIIRRQVYERNKYPWVLGVLSQANDNRLYIPRGSSYQSKESTRFYRVIKELREGSGAISELPELSPILEEWRNIDGFNGNLSTLDIQRNLNARASQAFCPLITMLRCPDGATYYIAQMSLALYAFGEQADAEAIAWLVAVANNGTMRDIEPPNIHRFTDFSHFPKLNKSHIEDLLVYAQDSYSAYVSARVNCDKGPEPRAMMKYKYEICIAQEADSVASWLEKAWPDIPLTFAQFVESWTELEFKYTDVAKAWEYLGPELQRLSRNLACRIMSSLSKMRRENSATSVAMPCWPLKELCILRSPPSQRQEQLLKFHGQLFKLHGQLFKIHGYLLKLRASPGLRTTFHVLPRCFEIAVEKLRSLPKILGCQSPRD